MRHAAAKTVGATMTALGSAMFVVSVPALGSPEAVAPRTDDPAGNNGFIKVDGQPFDDTPDNQPHVGCVFQVDFYNYDEGVGEAFVTFQMHAPTSDVGLAVSGDTSPDIGEDAAGGGEDLDASVTYTLSFDGEPHPVQGYHVKLLIEAPGSQGSDEKHKTFWVTPCAPTTTEPSTTEPSTTEPSTTAPSTTVPTSSPPQPSESTPPVETTIPSSVAPTTSQAPSQPAATTAPPTDFHAGVTGSTGGPGDTGAVGRSPLALAGLLGGLGMAASGLTVLARRRADEAD